MSKKPTKPTTPKTKQTAVNSQHNTDTKHTNKVNNDNTKQQHSATDISNQVELEALKTQLEDAQQSAKESYDKMLRIQAEMENLRRRNAKDIESAHKFALERFAKSLLEVVDSMVMGIQSIEDTQVSTDTIRDGMQMTHKVMLATLEKFDIKSIDPMGEQLNPERHEAISIVSVPDTKANTITQVVQVGWELNGRIIRPAMVIVAE